MTKPTVAVATGALLNVAELEQELADRLTLVSGPVDTPDQVAELTQDADALVVSLQPLRAAHVAALGDRVQVIGRAGVGLDTIDLAAAQAAGRSVVYQPHYATQEVADQAVALLMATHRRALQADLAVRSGSWPGASELGSIPALSELTLGVLGCGRIGQMVIERLRPFVAQVAVYDTAAVAAGEGVTVVSSLSALLASADLLTLHLPLNEHTRHIVGAAELAQLPPGALVVNVSRGGLIDETALAASLVSGHLRAAGLDVFEQEPLPAESPLRTAPNTVLSPHMAWYSDSSGPRLARWTLLDVAHFLTDGEVRHGAVAVEGRTAAGARP